MKTFNLECEHCGVGFESSHGHALTCSSECRRLRSRIKAREYNARGRVEPRTILCEGCGEFFKTTHRGTKTCGIDCRRKRNAKIYKERKDEGYYKRGRFSFRFDVLQRDNFKCRYCGASGLDEAELHIDHVRPKQHGGINDISNYLTACKNCNLGKSDRRMPQEIENEILERIKELNS